VGTLGLAGFADLGLDQIIRARAAAPRSARRHSSVIFVELAGGPTQFETYDPKPDAPQEYRGAFGVLDTRLPGVLFSEWMPRQAAIADKLTIIRSIYHPSNSHDPSSHLTQTGYYKRGPKGGPNQMPAFGCVVAKLRAPDKAALPAYVAVPRAMRNGGPAHLGKSYNPFETSATRPGPISRSRTSRSKHPSTSAGSTTAVDCSGPSTRVVDLQTSREPPRRSMTSRTRPST